MALDVYVGPLARYYAGDWESVSESADRERAPSGRLRRSAEAGRILQSVLGWRQDLAAALGGDPTVLLDWNERLDGPYFTGRPGWDGFGSLVLWAAYAEHPALVLPTSLPEEWDNDPALVRCNADGFRSRYSHLVHNVELWLPSAFAITFEGEDVDRRRVVIGSAATLARQLVDLNSATWKGSDAELAMWGRRQPSPNATLELRARYGFAVMARLARRAVEYHLPMKLDF